MRAEARAIGAVLAARGDTAMEEDAEDLRHDMARVLVGEGAEPWIVDTKSSAGVRATVGRGARPGYEPDDS